MNPTQFVSIIRATFVWLCVSCFAVSGFAEPIGTLVREFNYSVMDFARDPIRERIYATTAENSVIVINTKTVQIDAEIFIGSNPRGLDVNADGSRLYVACSGSTTTGIGVVDLATLEKLPSLPTPYAPADVAAGLGGRLYISPMGGGGGSYDVLKQISAVDGAVQADMGGPFSAYYGAQLALTPDRTKLFMGNVGLSPGTLVRFDVATAMPVIEQTNSHGSLGSNGQRVIMSHTGDGVCYAVGGGNSGYDIRLIPIGDVNGSMGEFNCGAYPTNGAFSPDDEFFYTAPDTQETVQVYNRNSFLKIASFAVPQDTLDMITDAAGRRLYLAGTDYFNPGKLRVYGTGRGVTELEINHPATVDVHRGAALRVEVTSSQSGVTFSATGLPLGVSIHAQTGVLSGTPSVAGNYTVRLRAVNTAGDAAQGELALHVLTPFTVTVDGGGSVTEELMGMTWQRIGAGLTLTATADYGSAFTGWTGSRVSDSPTLTITVVASMSLVAHFDGGVDFTVETAGPGGIYPQSLLGTTQRVAGEQVMLRAVPDLGARFVGWRGSVTSTANPLNVTIEGGETIVANFEVDTTARLTVSANGSGAVSGVAGGKTLHHIGELITLRAVPVAGARFIGWVGDFTSVQNPLSFVFTGPTTVVAQFESLQNYAGSFRALLAPDSVLEVKVGKDGLFTGKLRHSGETFNLKGNIAEINGATFFLERKGEGSPLAVGLRLAPHEKLPSLLVQLDDGAQSFTAVASRREVIGRSETSALAGRYTVQIPPPDSALFGYGYGTANVTRTGSIRIAGMLGDGRAFSEGTYLTEGDDALIHIPLYRKEGLIAGTVHFDTAAVGSDFAATLSWSRPAQLGAKQYAEGFTLSVTMLGSRFQAAATGGDITPFSEGCAVIEGGGLASQSTTEVKADEINTIISTQPALGGFTARLLPKNGKVSGSFQPGGRGPRQFSGVVFQKTGVVIGLHIGPIGVGSVLLEER